MEKFLSYSFYPYLSKTSFCFKILFTLISLFFYVESTKGMEKNSDFELIQKEDKEELLGYKVSKSFLDPALQPRTPTFERIEFLGDRVLGLTVAHLLYESFPAQGVDVLAQNFEILVSNYKLAKMYKVLDIEPVRLTSSYYNPPLNTPLSEKTMSDIVEAIMGAMYQEGSLSLARAFGAKLFKKRYEFPQTTSKLILPGPLSSKIAGLEDLLSYRFNNIKLLKAAFRHPSAGGAFYKKLDFIGVRVLALAVAENIFYSYPDCEEGILTDLFTRTVSNENLKHIFKMWHLARYLSTQCGNGLFFRHSIISTRIAVNTVRTLIGAVYLDGDWEAAQSICHLLLYSEPPASSSQILEKPSMSSSDIMRSHEKKNEIPEEIWSPLFESQAPLNPVFSDKSDEEDRGSSQHFYQDILMIPDTFSRIKEPSKATPDDPWPSLSGTITTPPKALPAWPAIKKSDSAPKPENQASTFVQVKEPFKAAPDDPWPSLSGSITTPPKAPPTWPATKKSDSAPKPENQASTFVQVKEPFKAAPDDLWPSLSGSITTPPKAPPTWPAIKKSDSAPKPENQASSFVRVKEPSKVAPDDPWPSLSGITTPPKAPPAWPTTKKSDSAPKPENQASSFVRVKEFSKYSSSS